MWVPWRLSVNRTTVVLEYRRERELRVPAGDSPVAHLLGPRNSSDSRFERLILSPRRFTIRRTIGGRQDVKAELVTFILSQAGQDFPDPLATPAGGTYLCLAFSLLMSAMGLLYFAFWAWMLVDCLVREPDRFFWVWLLVIIPFPGAIAYAVARVLPQREFTAPRWMRAWTRGKELARLQIAAEQIGNPHQFILWGDALREVSSYSQAEAAYRQATAKDPESIQALWGLALCAEALKRPADVKDYCAQVLKLDPQYKFGDVSLAYGRALCELGDEAAARQHLEQHVRRWRHPEAMYLLAVCCRDAGNPAEARQHLQAMLRDINGSPASIARKFGRWKSRANRLLRQLPVA